MLVLRSYLLNTRESGAGWANRSQRENQTSAAKSGPLSLSGTCSHLHLSLFLFFFLMFFSTTSAYLST